MSEANRGADWVGPMVIGLVTLVLESYAEKRQPDDDATNALLEPLSDSDPERVAASAGLVIGGLANLAAGCLINLSDGDLDRARTYLRDMAMRIARQDDAN